MKKLFFFHLIFQICLFSQTRDANLILKKVTARFEEVKDYVVNAKIKIDVNFLKVPDSEAKIYFKQPDKIHLESENFALLPKEGLNFSPLSLLKGNYTAIYEKDDTVGGIKTSVVKVIPLGEESNVVLTSLWIDQSKYFIMKIESTTKANGTFSIDLNYPKYSSYPLPSSIVFTFNFDKRNLNRITDNLDPDAKKEESPTTTTGKVFINYSDYKVNQGLNDSIFQEKKK